MLGVELVENRRLSPRREMVDRLLHRAYHNGLLLAVVRRQHAPLHAAALRDRTEVDEAMIYLKQSLDEVLAGQA